MVMRLRKGETVFSSAGELVVTHQVLDDEPQLSKIAKGGSTASM